MSRLRQSMMAKVLKAVERSYFGASNFEVNFPDSGESLAVVIFSPKNSLYFRIGETESNPSQLYTQFSPGKYRVEDISNHISFDNALYELEQWVTRIREDIFVRLSVDEELDAFRQYLEKSISENVKNENEIFSQDEVTLLQSKFEELEHRLVELQEKNEITEKELRKLQETITQVRRDLEVFPKGIWYRSSANKIWEVMKKVAKTKEAREVLASAAKKLLGLEP